MHVQTFTGTFQLWAYTVGHSRLLLRSTKSAERATQIDILFKDVTAIHLPTTLDDFEVSAVQPTEDQLHALGFAQGRTAGQKLFVLKGDVSCGYVLAGAMVSDETSRDYFEPSPWMAVPGASGQPRVPTTILAPGAWTEVWIDTAGSDRLLAVQPSSINGVEIRDPQEGWRVVHTCDSYEDAVHWLNEDEYDLVEGRWHRR